MNLIDLEPTTDDEMEDRLRRTFTAVADQTDASAPSELGFLPTLAERRSEQADSRSRSSWLLGVAASLMIAALGVAYFGQSRQPTETTPAASQDEALPSTDADNIDVATVVGDDGILHLLPPNAEDLTSYVEWDSGSEASIEGGLSRIAVGKPASNGFESVYAVIHTEDQGWFHYEPTENQQVAGRTLMESYDEGVVERLDDGTFIVYQAEFGDPALETLVAGTAMTDGRLSFDSARSDFEEISRVENVGEIAASTLVHEPPDEEGDAPSFRLMTMAADEPTEAIAWAADFMFPSLRSITVNGRPGWVDTQGLPFGRVSIVAWSPADGFVSVLMTPQPDDEAIAFAEQMSAVDGTTWHEVLGGADATGEDAALYLLPDSQDDPTVTVSFASKEEAELFEIGSRLVVGRQTDDGFQDLVSVAHKPFADDLGAGNGSVANTLSVEQPDDVGQVSFASASESVDLELVAEGTRLDSFELDFDGGSSGLETVVRLHNNSTVFERTEVTSSPTSNGAGWPAFTLVTARQLDDELEAVGHAVYEFGVPSLDVVELAGGSAYVYSTGSGDNTETVIAWSPDAGHVAALRVTGISQTEADAFAQSLSEVDSGTWRSTLESAG